MFDIVWQVIAPIFLMMGVGWAVQKRLGLDSATLTRLNFWVFVPAFLWVKIVESNLQARDIGIIALHFAIVFVISGILSWQAASWIGAPPRVQRALTASVLFYNSGNYGVPAAQLAFGANPALAALAVAVQAIVIMLQNVTTFTIGVALHAGGREGRDWRHTVAAVARLPMVYVLVGAWTWRWSGWQMLPPVNEALHFISGGLVPVALITLGAQMAQLRSHRVHRALILAVGLRLVIVPLIGWAVVWLLGVRGHLAQSLIVSVSFPTAVNSALIALEYDNESDFAAATVFYTTLLSAITVSFFVFAARVAFPVR